MNMSTFLGIASPYTTQELYELWFKFRDDPNAEKMLSDFMQSDTASAARLIDEFESRFQHDHRYPEGEKHHGRNDGRIYAQRQDQSGVWYFPDEK